MYYNGVRLPVKFDPWLLPGDLYYGMLFVLPVLIYVVTGIIMSNSVRLPGKFDPWLLPGDTYYSMLLLLRSQYYRGNCGRLSSVWVGL